MKISILAILLACFTVSCSSYVTGKITRLVGNSPKNYKYGLTVDKRHYLLTSQYPYYEVDSTYKIHIKGNNYSHFYLRAK